MAVDPTKALIVPRGPVVEGEILRPVGSLTITLHFNTPRFLAAMREFQTRQRAHPDAHRIIRPPDEATVIDMEG